MKTYPNSLRERNTNGERRNCILVIAYCVLVKNGYFIVIMYRTRGAENCWRREAGDHVYVRRTRAPKERLSAYGIVESFKVARKFNHETGQVTAIDYNRQSPRRIEIQFSPSFHPSVNSCRAAK